MCLIFLTLPLGRSQKYTANLKSKISDIDDVTLFPYLKYDYEKDMFECSICNKSTKVRNNLLRHLKLKHRNGIQPKIDSLNSIFNENKSEEKLYDCQMKMCKKFYGYNQKQLWCTQCTVLSQIPKKYAYDKKKYQQNKEKEKTLCPECGKNVYNLNAHLRDIHR